MEEFHVILLAKPAEDEELKQLAPDERVFGNKIEALKNMKKWKQCNPRMKTFQTKEDALYSAHNIVAEEENLLQLNGNASEGCPFKGLIAQELKKIKEAILRDDETQIRELVATNPRYIMSPCDQPAIIHSGTRANALHIAANAGKTRMAEVILELVTDPMLVKRMYPNDSPESLAKRQEYLLDLYLNMPKKGDFDTPLHQASKWGHWQVVQLLVEFSSCDTKRKNKDQLWPEQVVCSRAASPVDTDVKKKILDLLADRVYIPVYRVEDSSMPGYVGDPVSPNTSSSEFDFVPFSASSPAASGRSSLISVGSPWLSPMSPQLRNIDSPLITVKSGAKMSPINSPISVRAYLGPLSPNDASLAKNEWKKHSPANKILRLTDPDKGLERQGRDIAKKYRTQLTEFWSFLDTYCDITSNGGLQMLENHLHEKEFKPDIPDKPFDDTLGLGDIEAKLANLNLNVTRDEMDNSSIKGGRIIDFNSNPNIGVLNILEDKSNPLPVLIESNKLSSKIEEPLSNANIWLQSRQPSDNNSIMSDNSQNYSFTDDQGDKNRLFRSDSNSSLESFASAVSSFNDSVYSAEEGSWNYIAGDKPSKIDEQVYQAIKECDIDATKFPRIHTWKCLVESSDPTERSRWLRTKPIGKLLQQHIPRLSFNLIDDE